MAKELATDLTLSLSDTAASHPAGVEAGAPALSHFGEYELVREIARGGMGVVYEARHQRLNRVCALKMILSGALASDLEIKRFFMEAQAAAQLDHPGIVPIYEIGEHEGRHFFTMALVEGPSLTALLRDGPLQPREAAGLVRQVALAVAGAHAKGILHRDLKPQNILLDRAGQPKVTDFGLARHVGQRDGLTVTGEVLGTPSYMAPEQAIGKTSDLGPAVDIYSLGAILYATLSGRPPFQAASVVETLKQVAETDPAPLRLVNRQVDRDLETICMKCLEKDPARRYVSAQALADDLGRYLDGEPISARSFNALERLTRALDRSHIDEGYEEWSIILFWWAGIVFVVNFALFFVIRYRLPAAVIYATEAAQFLLMALPVWRYRAMHALSANPAQKQLWSIWIGFLIACFVVGPVQTQLMGLERMYEFAYMPHLAVLSGLCFFILGSNYWGWLYGVGLLFFGWAYASSFYTPMSPIGFGVLWGFALALLAVRLRARRKL